MIKIKTIKQLIADYMASEGCSCCESTEEHDIVKEKLARLLHIPKYKDGSGYDFGKYRSKKT